MAAPDSSGFVATSERFRFHSDFWVNLHHVLHAQARAQRGEPDSRRPAVAAAAADTLPLAALTEGERQSWDGAVEHYVAGPAARDLLFNSGMIELRSFLAELGPALPTSDARIEPGLAAALVAAAPPYRRGWWAAHDAANRAWVAGLLPLLAEHEAPLAPRLAGALGTSWPADPVRVDVTAYANWAGAYTTLRPTNVVISSTAPGNAGSLALETVFHEAGHALVERVREGLERAAAESGTPPPERLWHSILFYTAGALVRERLPDHVPYAERFGIWERSDPHELDALREHWQAWLAGESSFEAALDRLVAELRA